jgi:hypothetical protein
MHDRYNNWVELKTAAMVLIQSIYTLKTQWM